MFVDYHLLDMTGIDVVRALMKMSTWKKSMIMILVSGMDESPYLYEQVDFCGYKKSALSRD